MINTIAAGIGAAFGFVDGVVMTLGFMALSNMDVYIRGHYRSDVKNQGREG